MQSVLMYSLSVMVVFCLSFLGTYYYKKLAIKKNIVANPNFRTLHQKPMPCGGGIVFALVFLIAAICFYFFSLDIDSRFFLALVVGGFVATCFGFIDDVIHINAPIKFAIQGCLAAWGLFCFDGGQFVGMGFLPTWLELVVSWFCFVGLMNAYNFIDGIDGLASSGAVSICALLAVSIYMTNGSLSLLILCCILGVSCFGFLVFNWPPASIFMGDSGSIFLGYCFGILILKSTMSGEVPFLNWLILFGYFAGDTIITNLVRMLTVKKWYGAHRSHAYQNLARIYGSHFWVTFGILMYHFVWLLPLIILVSLYPSLAIIAAGLALFPSMLLALKFGPLLSSD